MTNESNTIKAAALIVARALHMNQLRLGTTDACDLYRNTLAGFRILGAPMPALPHAYVGAVEYSDAVAIVVRGVADDVREWYASELLTNYRSAEAAEADRLARTIGLGA